MHHDNLFNERYIEMRVILRRSNKDEKDRIRSLLLEAKLPAESLETGATVFYIAEENGRVAGVAGFEFYGEDALLRSVAVLPELRHQGIGSVIVDLMLEQARKINISRIVLLTETAKDFFTKKGFEVIERAAIVNDDLKRSSEFTQACPQSAVCMAIVLNQK